jgi:hypothetical protein
MAVKRRVENDVSPLMRQRKSISVNIPLLCANRARNPHEYSAIRINLRYPKYLLVTFAREIDVNVKIFDFGFECNPQVICSSRISHLAVSVLKESCYFMLGDRI